MTDWADRRRPVVITGAAGAIGSLISSRLGGRWRIQATDLRAGAGIEPLDVSDRARCVAMFSGADAVVHLAANPDPGAEWEALRDANVDGAYAVAAAAGDCGVRRLVLASSVHAVSGHPPSRQRRGGDPPRPANLYGATKAWAEALGSWVASTSPTSVVALRIGHFASEPPDGREAASADRSAWLSPDDCTRLIRAAVETELTGFRVINGISANRYRLVELGEAERELGYEPTDDAWREERKNRA